MRWRCVLCVPGYHSPPAPLTRLYHRYDDVDPWYGSIDSVRLYQKQNAVSRPASTRNIAVSAHCNGQNRSAGW